MKLTNAWLSASALALFTLAACTGSIGDDRDGRGPGGTDGFFDNPQAASGLGQTTRFARLTHEQWDRTIADLFFFDDGAPLFSEQFRIDSSSGKFLFDNDTAVLSVDQALLAAYERAAAAVAAYVVSDAAIFDRIVPSDGSDEERAAAFIDGFGERAHRRPVEAEDRTAYLALFSEGQRLYSDTSGFNGGIRLVIEAMLVSPYFLYRTELAEDPTQASVALTPHGLASRLSYSLWNTMPDEALFAAARDGSLLEPDALLTQVERMLGDERADALLSRVHSQMLGVERHGLIRPSDDAFPSAPDNLAELATTEATTFLADSIRRGESWREVLTSSRTFVNADLAAIYGLEGEFPADEFVEVDLDPNTRRGIFTHVGFLAANSTSLNPDPIHRGLYINQRLLCGTVDAPPDEIPPLPVPEPDQTNREVVETLTEEPGSACAACHSTAINPFGFPFEMYDAVGAVRDNDRGLPLDTTSTIVIDGADVAVADAVELIDALAESEEVQACYGQHVASYIVGRTYTEYDAGLRDLVAERSDAGDSLRAVFTTVLTSRNFTHRVQENAQ